MPDEKEKLKGLITTQEEITKSNEGESKEERRQ